MSLQARLEKIKNTRSAEDLAQSEAKKIEEQNLSNAKIKDMELEKYELELLSASLTFHQSSAEDGVVMAEYSEYLEDLHLENKATLEKIISENKDLLAEMGVETIEKLTKHPDLSQDREVREYQEVIKNKERLIDSDKKLLEKLSSLGIDIDESNFSYDEASAQVNEKLKELNLNLIKEKQKTPEGKLNLLAELGNKYDEEIPNPSLSNHSSSDLMVFSFEGYDQTEFQRRRDGTVQIRKYGQFWNYLPKSLSEDIKIYTEEAVTNALKNVFAEKINQAWLKSEEERGEEREYKRELLEGMNDLINYVVIKKALAEKYQNETPDRHLEYKISLIMREKEDAISALSALYHMQHKIGAHEEIIINNARIKVASWLTRQEEINKLIEDSDSKIDDKEIELRHENMKGPTGLFGKGKWQGKISKLEGELNILKAQREELNQEHNEAHQKANHVFQARDFTNRVGELILNYNGYGLVENVFAELEAILKPVAEQSIPEELTKDLRKIERAGNKIGF